jgi:hypothetical protein
MTPRRPSLESRTPRFAFRNGRTEQLVAAALEQAAHDDLKLAQEEWDRGHTQHGDHYYDVAMELREIVKEIEEGHAA